MDNNQEQKSGAAQHAAVGAGIGGAGVASSVALVGLAALPLLPVFLIAGAVGGLAWWGVKEAGKS